MILTHLNHHSGSVPFFGMRASFILNPHPVTHLERGQGSRMLAPCVLEAYVAMPQGLFPQVERLTPYRVGGVFPGKDGDQVLGWPPKYTHCRGCLGGRVRCVSVLEDCLLELVNVEGAVCPCVAGDQPFHVFYADLRPAITVGKGH